MKRSYAVRSRFKSNSRIVIYPGDALEFLRTIPSESIQLIMTSPPYNIGKEYERRNSLDDYLSFHYRLVAEMFRILRKDGSVCWQVGNYIDKGEIRPLDVEYYELFKRIGFALRNRIIWHFGHGLHASRRFSGRYETVLWFTKTSAYQFNLNAVRVPAKYPGKRHYKGPNKGKLSGNPEGTNPSDIWRIVTNDWENQLWNIPNVKANHPEKSIQPCQFPIELVERCVLALSRRGDWVLDPFLGVGSTSIGALLHDRRVAGSEKEKRYVREAKKRIELFFKGKLKIRPITRPVYVPTGKEQVARIPLQWQTGKKRLDS